VVTVHPTNLDTHGAGLTFHGVHAKLATYVPHTDIEPFVLFHDTRGVVGNQPGVVGNQTEVVGQLTLIVAMDPARSRSTRRACREAATSTQLHLDHPILRVKTD
jgi:hypothetical protein